MGLKIFLLLLSRLSEFRVYFFPEVIAMRKFISLGWILCALSWAAPASAAEADSRIFAFGKRAQVYVVVYAAPVFDGTGYASQSHLAYLPGGGYPFHPNPYRTDYYRVVREMP